MSLTAPLTRPLTAPTSIGEGSPYAATLVAGALLWNGGPLAWGGAPLTWTTGG